MTRQEVPAAIGPAVRSETGTNAFEETLSALLRELSLGTYLVGDKLPPERDLALELKVSRATLREALQALRDAGIVSVTRGRYGGTEVVRVPCEHAASTHPLTADEIDDALRFLELLERLRAGDPAIRRLLDRDPFDGVAPEEIRVRYVAYRYATGQERRRSGRWWIDTDLGVIARV